MENNTTECNCRQVKCVGEILGVWKCDWFGLHKDFESHLITKHSYTSEDFYSFHQIGSVEHTRGDNVCGRTINLINAFGHQFVFYYYFDSKIVKFIIYLMGRKDDSDKYLYHFEIFPTAEPHRKIKFIEYCYNDDEIIETVLSEKHILLTYDTIKSYMENERTINFRFIIKGKDKKSKVLCEHKKSEPLKEPNKPHKSENLVSKNKGKISSNSKKDTSNLTTNAKPTGSWISNPKTTSVDGAGAQHKSSINKQLVDQHPKCPLISASINRIDNDQIIQSKRDIYSRSNSQTSPQPYKNIDEKLYRTKYPTTSLSKARFSK